MIAALHIWFSTDANPLPRGLSAGVSYGLIVGAALGILSVSWGVHIWREIITLRRRLAALEAKSLAGPSD